jgi:hypothetical protein
MELSLDAEVRILETIRRIPEADRDAAWQCISEGLRFVVNPSRRVVDSICAEALRQYGRSKEKETT